MLQRQGMGDDVLGVVGVLVLINQQVLEPALQFLEDFRMVAKSHRREHQQIVEVHRVILPQKLLILRVNRGELPLHEAAGLVVILGRDQLILRR